MSKHNYSQYSNKKNNYKTAEVETPVVDLGNVAVVEEAVEAVEAVVNENPAEVKMESKPATIKGVVANCMKLNVRAKPRPDADVVCVLDVKSEMEIDMAKSTSEWFHVSTAIGVDGYCMRKYVNAKL